MATKVLVLGGGMAGLSAAISARESGAEVELWDAAPAAEAGGNTTYATGSVRTIFDGLDDLRRLMPDLSDAEAEGTDFGSYTADDFMSDLGRLSDYRFDVDLAATIVDDSLSTWLWLRDHGLRFVPMFGRQTFIVDGRMRFWGGLAVEVAGGGAQIVERLSTRAEQLGVIMRRGVRATGLILGGGAVCGARGRTPEGETSTDATATIVATGGFESNAQWRTAYLGPDWDLAKVRGSRFAMGDGIRMAIDAGAQPFGHWSGCHAVAWDANAPVFGRPADGHSRHSYPIGIMVNSRGRRFVDEGADFRNYTYGILGAHILKQPGHRAWQIFDANTSPLLREEYRGKEVTRVTSETLGGLGDKIPELSTEGFLATVRDFNDAVDLAVDFNPAIRDGRSASGLDVPRTNWAQTVATPPFQAYEVTSGITYTYGGVRVGSEGQVLDGTESPIAGLFAAGNSVGGLFYENSPSGASLTAGAVLGRRAGKASAATG